MFQRAIGFSMPLPVSQADRYHRLAIACGQSRAEFLVTLLGVYEFLMQQRIRTDEPDETVDPGIQARAWLAEISAVKYFEATGHL